jgi:hypothetical protein
MFSLFSLAKPRAMQKISVNFLQDRNYGCKKKTEFVEKVKKVKHQLTPGVYFGKHLWLQNLNLGRQNKVNGNELKNI